MKKENWHDLGPVRSLKDPPLRQITIGRTQIALSFKKGKFGAVSGVCNHAGGPLGEGTIDGEFLVCPWHHYKFHRRTGKGEPGFEKDCVPRYELQEKKGHLWLNLEAATKRNKLPHPPHALERPIRREKGPVRVLGVSTTAMDAEYPRYSTSDALLQIALDHAEKKGHPTQLIKLNDLKFRQCEGYYSKSAHACTWPCSITQMDPKDEMEKVYEAIVFWADVVIVSTPIRWGNASSLYYKMTERLNCVQNQITTHDRVMIQNKVISLIITGGQDNIQAVAGQMLSFFSELGFHFPQFPFIAHSRGWSAEDMERNVAVVKHSKELAEGAAALTERSIKKAARLIESGEKVEKTSRGGRKAHRMPAE